MLLLRGRCRVHDVEGVAEECSVGWVVTLLRDDVQRGAAPVADAADHDVSRAPSLEDGRLGTLAGATAAPNLNYLT